MPNQNQELESVTGEISSVKQIKTGQSQRTDGSMFDWILFEVVINGQTYRTFETAFQNMIGKSGEWKFKTERRQGRNGQWYESKTLLNFPKEREGATNRVEEKLDKIIEMLEGKKQDSPEDYEPEPGPEGPPPGDVPF